MAVECNFSCELFIKYSTPHQTHTTAIKALPNIGYTWSSVRAGDYWIHEDEMLARRYLVSPSK